MHQARRVGQAEEPAIGGQLQVEDRLAPPAQQLPGLAQGEGQARPAIAHGVGIDLLHQPAGQAGKGAVPLQRGAGAELGQSGLALDLGNDVAQRGEALPMALGLHGATGHEQNRNI